MPPSFFYGKLHSVATPRQRALTRITFDQGLQFGVTWSPDGRFIAYSSDRAGKFDIWVQQVSGGDSVQITIGPGHNWQPEWSPDGKYIAYRSEGGAGGLFVIPALGGMGLARKIVSGGFYPRWSPDSSRILFQSTVYVTAATGGRWIHITDGKFWDDKPRWAPDGKTLYFLSREGGFYDVWGIRFDSVEGKVVGWRFRLTAFDSPA